MKVNVIQTVIVAVGTLPKELVKGQDVLDIRGQVETIQTIVFLR